MMQFDHPANLSSAERFNEIASILARAAVRLHAKVALPPIADSVPVKSPESDKNLASPLEFTSKTVLSVCVG